MGNRFSRGRDAPANSAETAPTEQKTPAEPAATQPAGDTAQTQEAIKTENLDVMGEPVTLMACLPNEKCVSECKVAEAPAASDPLTDAEPVAKETPAPVQPEPLVSVSDPSPPEAEPKPVAEAQLAPEPAPEAIPEPEAVSIPKPETEVVPEPISESVPAPAEALEQKTDLAVPDVTPQPVDIPAPINSDEPSDIPGTEQCQDIAEASVIPASEPEKIEETSESLEKLTEVKAAENMEQVVSDVNEENVSGLLKNLELKENNLVADPIPTDVKIPDGTSTELM